MLGLLQHFDAPTPTSLPRLCILPLLLHRTWDFCSPVTRHVKASVCFTLSPTAKGLARVFFLVTDSLVPSLRLPMRIFRPLRLSRTARVSTSPPNIGWTCEWRQVGIADCLCSEWHHHQSVETPLAGATVTSPRLDGHVGTYLRGASRIAHDGCRVHLRSLETLFRILSCAWSWPLASACGRLNGRLSRPSLRLFHKCARVCRYTRDVLNVHTEAFLNPHTGFSTFFSARRNTHKNTQTHTKHTHTHTHQTHTHTHTKHTHTTITTTEPQNTTHNITRRQRQRETERDRGRKTENREKRRQKKTRRDKKAREDERGERRRDKRRDERREEKRKEKIKDKRREDRKMRRAKTRRENEQDKRGEDEREKKRQDEKEERR